MGGRGICAGCIAMRFNVALNYSLLFANERVEMARPPVRGLAEISSSLLYAKE
jgi:hypothetical protein